MKVTESELKNMIRESIEEVVAQGQGQMMNQANAPGLKERAQRVGALNKQLWAIKKEADELELENVSKWIYLAIQSVDREFVGDTVSNAWNKAKETVGGWFNGGQQQ